jgi:hypothetical protein
MEETLTATATLPENKPVETETKPTPPLKRVRTYSITVNGVTQSATLRRSELICDEMPDALLALIEKMIARGKASGGGNFAGSDGIGQYTWNLIADTDWLSGNSHFAAMDSNEPKQNRRRGGWSSKLFG